MLFRDAAAIENLRKVDTLIVDKTGTLTEGKPAFDRVVAAPGFDDDEVLRLAASLDQGSEHPLAAAIVARGARARPRARRSRGVRVRHGHRRARPVDGKALALGNTVLMQQIGVDAWPLGARRPKRCAREGASVMFVAVDGRLAGPVAVSDPIKDTTRRGDRARCAQAGIRVVMATGDGADDGAGRRRRSSASTRCTARCARTTS